MGWTRSGSEIAYFANPYPRHVSGPGGPTSGEGSSSYYTLTFTITFRRPGDTVLLAHSYPYTYADHKSHLEGLLTNRSSRRHIQHSVLCKTLSGLDCDVLTITGMLRGWCAHLMTTTGHR